MGKHRRFRLSAMVLKAWLYKLRNMTKVRGRESAQSINSTKTSHPPKPRQPYYYPEHKQHLLLYSPKSSDTHFPIHPPSKSSNTRPKKPKPLIKPSSTTKLIASSVSAGCRIWSSDIAVHHHKRHTTDIITDVTSGSKSNSKRKSSFYQTLDHCETCELPPVLTKPPMKQDKVVTPPKEQCKSPARWSPCGIHRLRLRASSPRLASKRAPPCLARRSSAGMQQGRGLPQSLAVMLWSSDPQRDFRDSMVEMIVENDIRASKDLEALLACYLSLNSKEYHDVIVKVFEQIWFDLTDIRL